MQTLWNWLMRTDAKSLFLACLLALLAMVGWRGYIEYDVLRDAREAAKAVKQPKKLPSFPDYQGLGILEYVEQQASPDARALPVDLFRPSLDSMVSNLVNAILSDPEFVVESPKSEPTPEPQRPALLPGEENLFDLVQRPDGQWVKRTRQQPPPHLTYNGVFKRTDGQTAAWITERNSRKTQFYGEGTELYGGRLKAVSTDEIVVVLPGGEERTVARGGDVTFPAPAAVVEELFVQAARAGEQERGRGERGGGPGVFRRGGAQRMPTEQELAAIARVNPELEQMVRDALRRRQEQQKQQKQGANP